MWIVRWSASSLGTEAKPLGYRVSPHLEPWERDDQDECLVPAGGEISA